MSSKVAEKDSEIVSSQEQLQPSKPCEYYSGITLIALGIILVLGGLTIAGVCISQMRFPIFLIL